MESINQDHIIRCPYCGKEYFPSEIFVPKNFIGTAFHLTEDLYLGSDMELLETYICDKCDSSFEVVANVSFESRKTIFGNFNEEFSQK